MKARKMKEGVSWVGAVDWDRRLFDALVPIPDGTSYNAYLIHGSERTALLDTVDPSMSHVLMSQLEDVENIDYVVAHHAEQDHSGTLPLVLKKYRQAKVIASSKGKAMLLDLLDIPEDRIATVGDRERLSLGDKTLEFIHVPWVHWPETMATYLHEDRILFSCDFFGSHIAASDLYVTDEARVYEAAKLYFAEIMMPYRLPIQKDMEKLSGYEIAMIAPSHGSIYDRPAFILEAYRDWVFADPKNLVVLPYVSTHGSTQKMVTHLVGALVERGVTVRQFELSAVDSGKLALALVDAATIVIGTSTIVNGPHPNAVYAANLINVFRPKAKFASVIGSYGWGTKTVEQLMGMMPNLKLELLEPVYCKGAPREAEFKALDNLAATISSKHAMELSK